MEYRVPIEIHVKIITHAIVQQSNNVMLVVEEYCKALLTASKHQEVSNSEIYIYPYTKS